MTEDIAVTISEIFSHPFVVLLIGALITKLVFLPQLLKDKSVTHKAETIRKIVEIKNLIKKIEFLHDRTVNTLALVLREGRVIPRELISSEILKLSNVLNSELPIQKSYLDTEIEIYFKDDEKIQLAYKNYCDYLKLLHDFILALPEQEQIFKHKLNEYKEIVDMDFSKNEKELIRSVQQGDSIYKLLR